MKVVATKSFFESFNRMFSIKSIIRGWFYDLKYGIKNLFRYFNVIIRIRSWDYNSILELIKIQIEDINKSMKKYSPEIEEDRLKKHEDMERCVVLINNLLKDDYYERCGYKPTSKTFDELFKEGNGGTFEYLGDTDNHSDEEFKEIMHNARELELSEINELFDTMKKIKYWWY
jgi:hypothetical protein